MRSIILFIIASTISILSCKDSKLRTEASIISSQETSHFDQSHVALKEAQKYIPKKHIYKESQFLDSTISILNSYPKGGSYTSSTGKKYGYGIFFSSIKNERSAPITINLKIPEDQNPIYHSLNAQAGLFLPSENFALDKIELFDYGIEDLSFFENSSESFKETSKTIRPHEHSTIYFAVLFDNFGSGPYRTELELRGNKLVYSISDGSQLGLFVISCGQLLF